MILVLLSSMVPYILPHAWLGEHYPGYDFYMFKGMAWTLKLALLIYLYGIVCIFTKNNTHILADKTHAGSADYK